MFSVTEDAAAAIAAAASTAAGTDWTACAAAAAAAATTDAWAAAAASVPAATSVSDETKDSVERALARLVRVTEKSGNLWNDLKKDILEAVSSLRNYLVQIQTELEEKQQPTKN